MTHDDSKWPEVLKSAWLSWHECHVSPNYVNVHCTWRIPSLNVLKNIYDFNATQQIALDPNAMKCKAAVFSFLVVARGVWQGGEAAKRWWGNIRQDAGTGQEVKLRGGCLGLESINMLSKWGMAVWGPSRYLSNVHPTGLGDAEDDAHQLVMGTLAAVPVWAGLHICNWKSALLPLCSRFQVIFGGNLGWASGDLQPPKLHQKHLHQVIGALRRFYSWNICGIFVIFFRNFQWHSHARENSENG